MTNEPTDIDPKILKRVGETFSPFRDAFGRSISFGLSDVFQRFGMAVGERLGAAIETGVYGSRFSENIEKRQARNVQILKAQELLRQESPRASSIGAAAGFVGGLATGAIEVKALVGGAELVAKGGVALVKASTGREAAEVAVDAGARAETSAAGHVAQETVLAPAQKAQQELMTQQAERQAGVNRQSLRTEQARMEHPAQQPQANAGGSGGASRGQSGEVRSPLSPEEATQAAADAEWTAVLENLPPGQRGLVRSIELNRGREAAEKAVIELYQQTPVASTTKLGAGDVIAGAALGRVGASPTSVTTTAKVGALITALGIGAYGAWFATSENRKIAAEANVAADVAAGQAAQAGAQTSRPPLSTDVDTRLRAKGIVPSGP